MQAQKNKLSESSIEVSIIIPHFNDQKRLENCLSSIAQQDFNLNLFEVIVCDNGSAEFKIDCSSYQFLLTTVIETKRGAAAARNAGIKVAKGRILAFTDCDCTLDTDFIKNGFDFITSLNQDSVVAGEITLASSKLVPNSVEAFEIIFLTNQEHYAKKSEAATGNLWVYKKFFHHVGEFRDGVAEDTDWCHRATKKGAKFYYAKNCKVFHPARQTLNELRSKWNRQIAMKYNSEKTGKGFFIRWPFLSIMTALSPFAHIFKALLDPKLPKITYKLKAIPILFWCRFYRAKAMLLFYLKNQEKLDPIQYWK